MMALIYRKVSTVIVINAMLQEISYQYMPVESITLYLLFSDWNRRLWTLTKALLATKISVMFQEKFWTLDNYLQPQVLPCCTCNYRLYE